MRILLRWLLFPLGIALVFAAFASQEGSALSADLQNPTPTFIPSDRLLQPTLPANPSQADQGAVDYWLNCMVCHGDQGQGLTDEFRMIYPPEEQTCWLSGCHGARPYEDGFTLPTAIPPVTGPEVPWHNFKDASVLYAFISSAMPWHQPSSLEPEVYWRLTAYLLRENGYENPYEELGPENAAFVPIGGEDAAVGAEQVAQITTHPTAQTAGGEMQELLTGHGQSSLLPLGIVIAFLVIMIGLFLWFRRKKNGRQV